MLAAAAAGGLPIVTNEWVFRPVRWNASDPRSLATTEIQLLRGNAHQLPGAVVHRPAGQSTAPDAARRGLVGQHPIAQIHRPVKTTQRVWSISAEKVWAGSAPRGSSPTPAW